MENSTNRGKTFLPSMCDYTKIRREQDKAEMTVRGTYCSQAWGKGDLKEFFSPPSSRSPKRRGWTGLPHPSASQNPKERNTLGWGAHWICKWKTRVQYPPSGYVLESPFPESCKSYLSVDSWIFPTSWTYAQPNTVSGTEKKKCSKTFEWKLNSLLS